MVKIGHNQTQVEKLSLQTADISYVPPQSVARLDILQF